MAQRNAKVVQAPESAGPGLARLVPVPVGTQKGDVFAWKTRKGEQAQQPILDVVTVGGMLHAVIAFRTREKSAATLFKSLTPEQQAAALKAAGL